MKNTLEHPYVPRFVSAPKAIYDVIVRYEGEEEKTLTRNDFGSVIDTLKTVIAYKATSIRVIRYKDGVENDMTDYCMRRI